MILFKVLSIIKKYVWVFVCFFLFVGCGSLHENNTQNSIYPQRVTVEGDKFIDENGRHVILNGINVVCKNKAEQYLYKGGPEFYKLLKEQGFNSIRFVIIWDGLEPEPGVYNEEYLKEIDKRIEWAKENNLFVILDMHQDLFSVNYSDGAPEWATLNEGKEHVTGVIWSDAYMMSEAVQTAFDSFWENKPASDGIGIQDHYAQLWKYIAKRYANNPTVIGYDIMNEPFAGSSAKLGMNAMLKAYGELVYKKQSKILSEEEILMVWGDENQRLKALNLLSSAENYSFVIDALYNYNHRFETTFLQDMYQRVADKIREVDDKSILFLEHSYFSNTGVKSSIKRVNLADGTPDPLVAYAPHGYDLVTDTKDAASANSERVSFIFNRIKEKGQELGMPIWLGEWGAYYNDADEIIPVAQYAVSLIEQSLFGNAYWSYYSGLENDGYFKDALLRPYAAYTSGTLMEYEFDRSNSQFYMRWQENEKVSAPTVIFIPNLSKLNKDKLPLGSSISSITNTGSGWLTIESSGGEKERELELAL